MAYPTNPPVKKSNKKFWIVMASILFVALCCGGAAVITSRGSDQKPVAVTQTQTLPDGSVVTTQAAAPIPFSIGGTGKQLANLPQTLDGAYKIDFTADPGGLVVDFLKADGSSGSSWKDSGINELNFDSNITGSTIVHLSGVTMIQTDNVDGAWKLIFTKIG